MLVYNVMNIAVHAPIQLIVMVAMMDFVFLYLLYLFRLLLFIK